MKMTSQGDPGEDETWNLRLRQDEEQEYFTELALHEAERWIAVSDLTILSLWPTGVADPGVG